MSKRILPLILCLSMLVSLLLLPVGAEEKAEAAYVPHEEFEIVGDWVWGETVASLGAATIVDRSYRYGITDLYMLAKGTGGKLSYLKTRYTDALTRTDRDVLQELITAAHAKGIRVHAWLVTVEDEHYKTNHPEAGMYHYVRGQDNNRLNPYDAGYQTYMTNIVKEIASGYDIDGIHLDYIRYNHVANGWGPEDFTRIAAMGANVDEVKYMINKTFYQDQLPAGDTVDANYLFNAYRNGDPTALLIGQYRRNNIVEFATKLRDAAKAAKPGILFTGALMPEGGITYGYADIAFGDLHYGQNYEDAAKLYDYIAPMAYSGSYGVEHQWMADIATHSVEVGNKVVMGLQSFYPLTSTDLMGDIEAVRYLLPMEGVLGIAHFRHTQFSYAKSSYNYNTGSMTIDVLNASDAGGYKWLKVEVPEGMKITKASVTSGFKSSTPISIASGGRTVTFGYSESSSSTILNSLAEGKLSLSFTGRPTDPKARPSLVRVYIGSNESRAYNVYEDLTKFTVKFVDHDGTVLASKSVYPGEAAQAPADPLRVGHVFTGWDKSFDNVTSNMTVTAQYEKTGVAGEFEIVGDWVWGETVASLGAETVVDRSYRYGITDLYMLAKGTGGKLSYLKTQYKDALARTDRDVMQELITAAHAKGIRVHAWLVTVEDEYYKTNHPEAGMYHYVRGQDNNRLNTYDAGYQTYMSNIVKEIASGYDIDGIHLDYIRYNHVANGWGPEDFTRIAAMGADVDEVKYMINKTFYQDLLPEGETVDANYLFNAYRNGDPTALLIGQYRRNNIVEFATKLRDAAKSANPDILFTGALMPEGGVTYGNEDIAFGDLHYGQNYKDAAEIYDYIAPMAYSASYEAEPQWMADIASYCVEVGNKVVMGLQSFYPLTSTDLMGDINAVRSLLPMEGVLGIAHFRHTQFSYSKASYDYKAGTMNLDVLNASDAGGYKWLKVEVPEGMKITSAKVVSGFASGSPISIASDGRTVTFGYSESSSSTILAALKEGKLSLSFTGKPADPMARPALVRIYINSNESRVYNIYEDLTKYTVTFMGQDGAILSRKTTYGGGTVIAPEAPVVEGMTFTGWDKSYENVREDLVITATYKADAPEVEDKDPIEDAKLVLNHSLNLASDISVNYAVSKDLLEGFDMDSVYLEVTMDKYTGNTLTGSVTLGLQPVERGNYYYFTLDGLTAVRMNDKLEAVLHGTKDGQRYYSPVDTYSIATYAMAQMNKSNASDALKTLCADLLRYGAKAQLFKGYRTDALVDELMDLEHLLYLSDITAVTFGNTNVELEDLENPTVTWRGKALDLNAKVGVRYIVDLSKYTGLLKDLKLVIGYVDINGQRRVAEVNEIEVYDISNHLYAFTFDGLLAAELRCVLSAAVYTEDRVLSNQLLYSADTYGNGKNGDLLAVCKALFAYSDSAKAFFTN